MNLHPLLQWQPHPDVWLLIVVLLGGYTYALSAWGPRHAAGRPAATGRQRLCFYAGVGTVWLAADWPIGALADALFSAHMAQHLVFSLVSAPLLLLGVPGWLMRRVLQPPPVASVWRILTRPIVALTAFNTWIVVYHWPPVVNLSVANDFFHLLVHVVWIVASLIMWWPVLSPLPELPHLSTPGRMLYLFGQSIVPTVPASFMTFGSSLLYDTYTQTPSQLGIAPITDQQVAGLLMKIGAGLFIWGVISVMFFRWSSSDERGEGDRLYWRDLDPDLEHLTTSTHRQETP